VNKTSIKIKDKIISESSETFIIAELSANHNQDYNIAIKTIDEIKNSGADAVKLQTYTPDTITIDCNNKYFQIKQDTIWDGDNFYSLYKKAYTPWEWQPKLKNYAESLGLICFSSPFDKTSVDFLEEMDVPAYKVASFEITDIPLIEYIASKGKPVIISTGIADLDDINLAINTCKKMNNEQIILLKCTSAYPAPLEEINLLTIPDMKDKFDYIIGLSDHTLGISVPIASIALGAKVIEKHFILDKKLGGPDSEFSLEPQEFKFMVQSVREVERALGKVNYQLSDKTKKSRDFSRSLFIVKDIKKGEIFNDDNIRSIRPGFGLAPKFYKEILGKKAKVNILRGTPLDWNLIDE
jgi:pseudaminic acid synthase